MDIDDEIRRVKMILTRLEPIVQRHLDKMIDEHGTNVTLSVSSNLATSMLAMCMLIIMRSGGNVEQFMEIMGGEINEKIKSALRVDTQAGQSTCQRLH
jgi:hypothetical protein